MEAAGGSYSSSVTGSGSETGGGGKGVPRVFVSIEGPEIEIGELELSMLAEEGEEEEIDSDFSDDCLAANVKNFLKRSADLKCAKERAAAHQKAGSLEVEKSMEVLKIQKDPGLTKAQKLEAISKVEEDRREAAKKKILSDREAWRRTQLKTIESRLEFRRRLENDTREEAYKSDDPDHKQLLSKLSPKWRETYKEGRTKFLFHDVLSTLHRRTKKGECTFLDTESILACRQVCHDWRDAVEVDLTQEFSAWKYHPNDPRGKFSPGEGLLRCLHKFQTSSKLMRFNFWSRHLYSGKNPLFSRKLSIGSGDQAVEWISNLGYWQEMVSLLKLWGKQVWQVDIRLDLGMTPELIYEQLCKLLHLMPNLRFLGLSAREVDKKTASKIMMDILQKKDPFATLKHRMKQNPLPELPHLRDLVVDDSMPAHIIRFALSKYGRTVETIFLKGPDTDPGEFLIGSKLPALKRLMGICNFPRNAEFTLECPSLEQLWLQYACVDGADGFRKIIQSVNKCAPGLKWLALLTNTRDEVVMPEDISLELPHLETFFFSAAGLNLKNIDFMLPCASLRDVNMIYHKFIPLIGNKGARFSRSAKGKEEAIQFSNYTDHLYESNIWKVFPELQKVSLCIYNILKKPNGRGYEKPTQGKPRRGVKDKVKPKSAKKTEWDDDDDDDQGDNELIRDYTREGYVQYCSMLKAFSSQQLGGKGKAKKLGRF